jgi:hypothetical protein
MASTATGRAARASPDGRAPPRATLRYSTSRACRPLYQPQLGQTTWGSLALVHWGQTERAGVFNTQLDARRLRLFDFEVFFFGTAIGRAS